jgi:hypothetical protein
VSFTDTANSKLPLSSVVVPLTLLMLMIFTLGKGNLVMSLITVPVTVCAGSITCEKAFGESIKKKKTTKYFINWFKTLKVIKRD